VSVQQIDLRKNKTILVTLTADTQSNIVTLIDPSNLQGKTQAYLSNAGVISADGNIYLKELDLRAEISSLLAPPPPDISDDDSDSQALQKVLNYEWKSPGKRLEILLQEAGGDWVVITEVALIGNTGYPYRTYNLYDMLTDNLAFHLEQNYALGARVINVGNGLLDGSDRLVIRGSYVEEVVVSEDVSPMQFSEASNRWIPFSREELRISRISPSTLQISQGSITLESVGGTRKHIRYTNSETLALTSAQLSDGWHHLFATWNPATSLAEFQSDTDASGSNIGSSDFKRWMGAYLVESGEIADFHHDGEWFVWKPSRTDSINSIPTTETLIPLAVPSGFKCDVHLTCHPGHAAPGSANSLLIAIADGEGALPTTLLPPYAAGANAFAYASHPGGETREFNSGFGAFQTDSNSSIKAKRAGNYLSAGNESTLETLKWQRAGNY